MNNKDRLAILKIKKNNKQIIKDVEKKYKKTSEAKYLIRYIEHVYNFLAQKNRYDTKRLNEFDKNIAGRFGDKKQYEVLNKIFSLRKCILKNKGICGSFSRELILYLVNNESGIYKYKDCFSVSEAIIIREDGSSHSANYIEIKNHKNENKKGYFYDITSGLQTGEKPHKLSDFRMIKKKNYICFLKHLSKQEIKEIDFLTYKFDSIENLYENLDKTYYKVPDFENVTEDFGSYYSIIKSFGKGKKSYKEFDKQKSLC